MAVPRRALTGPDQYFSDTGAGAADCPFPINRTGYLCDNSSLTRYPCRRWRRHQNKAGDLD